MFKFRGLRFLLFLEPEGLDTLPSGIGLPGENWGGLQLNFHNAEIKFEVNGRPSHIIQTKW